MEASQTRDYCVAKNATHRAARSDPSQRKSALFRMTSKSGVWVVWGSEPNARLLRRQEPRRIARLAQILPNAKSALLKMTMDWVLSCWPIGISSPASDGLDQAERHQAEPEIDDEAQIDLEGYVSRSWRQMLQQ
jgi:hypothetical protein